MSSSSTCLQGVYAIDCSSIDQTVPDNTPRLPACKLQQWHSQKKVTLIQIVYDSILTNQASSAACPSLSTDQMTKAGLYSRKTSQVSGNHLPPPANMYWSQNRQEDGQLHQHQHGHGQEDEAVELKTT